MKKKPFILSVFALILCGTMLAGLSAPVKKPIPARELCMAEEVIEYTIEEENSENETEEPTLEEESECETCIFVVGSAKLTLSPDMATITACIEKFNEDMNVSKNENLETLNVIMTSLKKNGVAEEKISLDYFNAHPSYDFTSGRNPIGYYSKSCFSFEISDLNNLSNYINILTENGVTDICNVCYSISNIDEAYNNALTEALENAKTKASKLTDCQNLEICRIKEECSHTTSSLCRQYVENISSSLIGSVKVEARVSVVFKCND